MTRLDELLAKARTQALSEDEKKELKALLRLQNRKEESKPRARITGLRDV